MYRYRRHEQTTTAQNARSFTRLSEETTLARELRATCRGTDWWRTRLAARLRLTIRLNGAVAVAGSAGAGARERGRAILAIVDPR